MDKNEYNVNFWPGPEVFDPVTRPRRFDRSSVQTFQDQDQDHSFQDQDLASSNKVSATTGR